MEDQLLERESIPELQRVDERVPVHKDKVAKVKEGPMFESVCEAVGGYGDSSKEEEKYITNNCEYVEKFLNNMTTRGKEGISRGAMNKLESLRKNLNKFCNESRLERYTSSNTSDHEGKKEKFKGARSKATKDMKKNS